MNNTNTDQQIIRRYILKWALCIMSMFTFFKLWVNFDASTLVLFLISVWNAGISTLLYCHFYKIEYFFHRWGIQGASLHSFIFHTQHLQEDTFLFKLHIMQQNHQNGKKKEKTKQNGQKNPRTTNSNNLGSPFKASSCEAFRETDRFYVFIGRTTIQTLSSRLHSLI